MKKRSERGAALVELALLLPFFILLIAAVIDFGDAWFKSTSVQTSLNAAARTGFDAGDNYDHDYRVLRTLMTEMSNIQNVERVIIYDAERFDEPPANCFSTARIWGVSGDCVSYSGNFLDGVVSGAVKNEFHPTSCPSSADSFWCAASRPPTAGGAYDVGVYVVASQDALTGLMPFFNSYSLEKNLVITEFKRT